MLGEPVHHIAMVRGDAQLGPLAVADNVLLGQAIFPKSKQAQQELAKFQSEQALKSIQKLKLVDAAVKHLKAQQ